VCTVVLPKPLAYVLFVILFRLHCPCPSFTVAFPFPVHSWEHFPAVAWAARSFELFSNMAHTDNDQSDMAASTNQVKL
jgi:hypothetical protein